MKAPAPNSRISFARPFSLRASLFALVALCVLWYAVILAFRSTFSIKYFQHVFGLPLDLPDLARDHRLLLVLGKPTASPQDLEFNLRLHEVMDREVAAVRAGWAELAEGADASPPESFFGGPGGKAAGVHPAVNNDNLGGRDPGRGRQGPVGRKTGQIGLRRRLGRLLPALRQQVLPHRFRDREHHVGDASAVPDARDACSQRCLHVRHRPAGEPFVRFPDCLVQGSRAAAPDEVQVTVTQGDASVTLLVPVSSDYNQQGAFAIANLLPGNYSVVITFAADIASIDSSGTTYSVDGGAWQSGGATVGGLALKDEWRFAAPLWLFSAASGLFLVTVFMASSLALDDQRQVWTVSSLLLLASAAWATVVGYRRT